MVSDIGLNQAVQQQQSQSQTEADRSALAQDFDDFLTLLTTQLQNQDPTEPLSTEEFTNQLVQFSQVEQSINTNTKLDELIALQSVDPLTGAANLVGLTASYEGSEFFFNGEQDSKLSYSLNNSAVDTTVTVTDQFGLEVFSTSGKTAPGSHEFVWDGTDNNGDPVEPGTYRLEVESFGSDGEPVTTATLVNGTVRGIETDGLNTFLLIGERAVPQSQILRLEQPDAPSGNDTSGGEDEPTDT